jgi:hypothetical protein
MSQNQTIAINGVEYDAHSGMPIEAVAAVTKPSPARLAPVHAKGVHATHQRSKTLNRQFTQKPKANANVHSLKKVRSMEMRRTTRSASISKFAPHPADITPVKSVDARPQPAAPVHHIVKKAHAVHAAKQSTPSHVPAKAIKEGAISAAMAHSHSSHVEGSAKRKNSGRSRTLNIVSASMAVLILAGYFTYVNMPGLSVRIAAAQAGIDASFPEYRPVGYSMNGPVAYSDGQVTMNFASNSGPQKFALAQSKSSWDSNALLEKYVQPKSNGSYTTYNDAGLTVYTYGSNAAWVSGGILHTVEGDAMLSNEQVRRIATSM